MEIIAREEHSQPALFREFYMGVYCFPKPKKPKQALAIKAIGSSENELAAIFIEMRDHEKITVVKGALAKAERMGLKGLIWFFFSGFLGEKLEMEVALSLGQANRTATGNSS